MKRSRTGFVRLYLNVGKIRKDSCCSGRASDDEMDMKTAQSVLGPSRDTVGLCRLRAHNGEMLPVSKSSTQSSVRAEVCRCIATCWPSYWPVAEDRV
jgi:hypothetical protein